MKIINPLFFLWALRLCLPERKMMSRDISAVGTADVKSWVLIIVLFIALFIIVAALLPELTTSLTSYAGNETTFGPILQTIVPILIGVGLLLLAIGAFLGKAKSM